MPDQPNPSVIFDLAWAYQSTAALRTAIDLDVFSAIAAGDGALDALARRTGASERGLRSLCDFLVVRELLEKTGDGYELTPASATFLDRAQPTCLASAVSFMSTGTLREGFDALSEAVREGGTALPEGGTMAPDHPVWVEFAQAMVPMMAPVADLVASELARREVSVTRVLDVAAGHGIYGIELLKRWPESRAIAVDWESVLTVARENAEAAGVGERLETLPGSVFDVELPTGLDLVLLPNFLHHFDLPTCEALLKRLHAAMAPGAHVAIVEFVPEEDRVNPPRAASFSLVMLATTPSGDAYTRSELERVLHGAGFTDVGATPLEPTDATLVLARRS